MIMLIAKLFQGVKYCNIAKLHKFYCYKKSEIKIKSKIGYRIELMNVRHFSNLLNFRLDKKFHFNLFFQI